MNNSALLHIRVFMLAFFMGLTSQAVMGQEVNSDISRISTKVLKGDANNDGYINMSDVTVVINYLLNKPSEDFVFAGADTNNDGYINMSDVTEIIRIILYGGSTDTGDPRLPIDDPEGGDPGTGV